MVRIDEVPIKSPAPGIPRSILDPAIRWRNAETLQWLAYFAEGTARDGESQ